MGREGRNYKRKRDEIKTVEEKKAYREIKETKE